MKSSTKTNKKSIKKAKATRMIKSFKIMAKKSLLFLINTIRKVGNLKFKDALIIIVIGLVGAYFTSLLIKAIEVAIIFSLYFIYYLFQDFFDAFFNLASSIREAFIVFFNAF